MVTRYSGIEAELNNAWAQSHRTASLLSLTEVLCFSKPPLGGFTNSCYVDWMLIDSKDDRQRPFPAGIRYPTFWRWKSDYWHALCKWPCPKIKQKSETFKTKWIKTESLAKFKLPLTSTSRIHKAVYLLRGACEPFGVENFALLILKERKQAKRKTHRQLP